MLPLSLGDTALAGSSGSGSRDDHVHTHGTITDGTAHAIADSGKAGFVRQLPITSGSYLDSTNNWSVPSGAGTYLVPWVPYEYLPPWDADRTVFTSTIFNAATIRKWMQTFYVAAPNGVSDWWDIIICRADTGGALTQFPTSDFSADTWSRHDAGDLSVAITTGMQSLVITIVKSGTPGAIYMHAPAVQVQE